MKGKVVSYDSTRGMGKIIVEDEGIRLFDIAEWKNYNKQPEIGLEVELELENNKISKIEVADSSNGLFDELGEEFSYEVPKTLRIKEDVSLKKCLDNFFYKYISTAKEYQEFFFKNQNIPYKKVKRFLITAYNNLLEMDFNIKDKSVSNVKSRLDNLEFYYVSLMGEIKNPAVVMLQKVFLSKQGNYKKLKRKVSTNVTLIGDAKSNSKSLEAKIAMAQEQLSKLKPSSKEYKNLEIEFKAMKKKYVDYIDLAQRLKDENAQIVDDVLEFEKVYKDIFKKFFTKQIRVILRILEKEINVLAFEFDNILWENAKNSKPIQHFFKEAKIEGGYSTKTFIKYYLKNLNSEKISATNAELFKILEDLSVFSKKVVIFDKSRERAKDISNYIENYDHSTDVKIFVSFKELILYVKDNDGSVDIALIEIEPITEKMVKKVTPILENIGVTIILFSDEIKESGVVTTKEMKKQLKNFI